MTSDPTTPDRDRRGADLLARIDELTSKSKLADYPDGNGWRYLLLACKREVARLTRERDEAHRQADEPSELVLAAGAVLMQLDYLQSLWGKEGVTNSLAERLRKALESEAPQ